VFENFPTRAADIKPEWLNSVAQGLDVSKITAVPLTENGLSASVERLNIEIINGDRFTLIAKTSARHPDTRKTFASYYSREVDFYSNIAKLVNMRVPTCFFAEYNPKSHEHLILLEDLGATAIGSTVQGVDSRFVGAYISSIAEFHAQWWEQPGLAELEKVFPPFGYTVGASYKELLADGLSLLAPFSNSSTTALALALEPRLQSLWDSQWQSPRTLIQWDAHASNTVRGGTGCDDLVMIDWQNCVVGNGICDIVRFCVLSMEVDERRRHEKGLVAEYVRGLEEHGVSVEYATCLGDYYKFMPLIFAQQLRFLAKIRSWDRHLIDWKEAIAPRVVTALHDSNSTF